MDFRGTLQTAQEKSPSLSENQASLAPRTLCGFCLSFDPADVQANHGKRVQEKDKTYVWYSMDYQRWGYPLKDYYQMVSSANDGCTCCSFFLSLIHSKLAPSTVVPPGTECYLRDRSSDPYKMSLSMKQPTSRHPSESQEVSQRIVEVEMLVCTLNRNEKSSFQLQRNYSWEQPTLVPNNALGRLTLAKTWFEACSSHTDCGRQDEVVLPARVIEIRPEQSLRLRETGGEKGRYAALSHCWGSAELKSKTTSSTLQRYRDRIDISELSLNFQDAISITQSLGLSYLWIDALCIIQDSESDWAEQSPKMADIYGKATVVICADASNDGQDGILRPLTRRWSPPVGRSKDVVLSELPTNDVAFDDLPLNTRGWAFQEQMLAHRALHFTDREMLWWCKSSALSECFGSIPKDHRIVADDKTKRALASLVDRTYSIGSLETGEIFSTTSTSLPRTLNSPIGVESCLDLWYHSVQNYSARSLTYSKDKLPAIAGIVSIIMKSDVGGYLAGLWEKDIFRGLSWYSVFRDKVATRSLGPQDERLPSWSWAAYDRPVGVFSVFHVFFGGPENKEELFHRETFSPKLIAHTFNHATAIFNPLMSVRPRSSITVEGYFRFLVISQETPTADSVWFLKEARVYMDSGWNNWQMYDPDNGPWLWLAPADQYPQVPNSTDFNLGHYCYSLLIYDGVSSAYGIPGHHNVVCLLLKQDVSRRDLFKRIGLLFIPFKSMYYSSRNRHREYEVKRWHRSAFTII